MGDGFFTVYNLVYDKDDKRHLVSIYNQTLSNPNSPYRYPEPDKIEPYDFSSQTEYYAYFSTPQGAPPVIIKTKAGDSTTQQNWGKPIIF